MPKTKIGANTKKDPYDPMMTVIQGVMTRKREPVERLAARMKLTPKTLYRRLKRPHELKISELQSIANGLEIPWSEITGLIPERS